MGTHGFCILILDSFLLALVQYKEKDHKKLLEEFKQILELIENVKPRYAILIDNFYKIMEQMEAQSIEEMVEHIQLIKQSVQDEMNLLLKAAEKIDVHHKTILIYDHSHSVQNVLKHLHEKGQRFKVLLAEQDLQKTEDNIAFFHQEKIPFKVVPAYMVSHVEDQIDMAFFGAVTFQDGGYFVMDPGSKSIISELKVEGKEICLFLTTSKFSLWPIKKAHKQIHVKSDIRSHQHLNEIEFERVKFSHDRVSVDLMNHIVTEKGTFTPRRLKNEFKKRMEERSKIKQKIKSKKR